MSLAPLWRIVGESGIRDLGGPGLERQVAQDADHEVRVVAVNVVTGGGGGDVGGARYQVGKACLQGAPGDVPASAQGKRRDVLGVACRVDQRC